MVFRNCIVKRVKWLPLVALSVLPLGCVEREFRVDENAALWGALDPSFAIPLGATSVNILQARLAVGENVGWGITPDVGSIMFVQPFEGFETPPVDLALIHDSWTFDWPVDDVTVAALNVLPAGESIAFNASDSKLWNAPDMESLDHVVFKSGSLIITLASDVPLDASVSLSIPNLRRNGLPIEPSLSLQFEGTTPHTAEAFVDLTGAVLNFTDDSNLEVDFQWHFEWTANGEMTDLGAEISGLVAWQSVELESVFGVYKQAEVFSFETSFDIQPIAGLPTNMFHLSDPRISLHMENTSGIPLGFVGQSIRWWNGTEQHELSGVGIHEFPVIQSANEPGDLVHTDHCIKSVDTSPSLCELLAAMPDSGMISGALVVNPDGPQSNFVTSESFVRCSGKLELPLHGWVQGLSWSDTLHESISQSLHDAINPPLDWQDVDALTIRLLATNGMPLGVRVQAFFLDAEYQVIDSLFEEESGRVLIEAGHVDPNLALTHPEYGRTALPTQRVVDLVFERDRALQLMSMTCEHVVIQAFLDTDAAAAGQDIRLFDADFLSVSLAARLDFHATYNP